jgi:hypothetical protein
VVRSFDEEEKGKTEKGRRERWRRGERLGALGEEERDAWVWDSGLWVPSYPTLTSANFSKYHIYPCK